MAKPSGNTETLRLEALRFLLRPIVRYCLRSSCALQDLIAVAKDIFIELASDELKSREDKINVSRLSVLTGIRRAEVQRILEQPQAKDLSTSSHFLIRVIGQWRNDAQFCFSPGEPKPLSIAGKDSEFRALCERVSTSINAGTIQYELERRKIVERVNDTLILTYRQLPLGSFPRDGLALLSSDLNDLITAAEENLFAAPEISNLHLRTEYDNIEPRYLPTIRRWLLDEGKEFHRRARNFLSQFDRDLNPELLTDKSQKGVRVSLSAHSWTATLNAQNEYSPPQLKQKVKVDRKVGKST